MHIEEAICLASSASSSGGGSDEWREARGNRKVKWPSGRGAPVMGHAMSAPTCGNIDDDGDGGSEDNDAFDCAAAGLVLKSEPLTISCASVT